MFVARETAENAGQLARQMGRGEVRAASIAWAVPEELSAARMERQAERPKTPRAAERDRTGKSESAKAGREDSLRAKVRDALAARQRLNAKAEPEKLDAALLPGDAASRSAAGHEPPAAPLLPDVQPRTWAAIRRAGSA